MDKKLSNSIKLILIIFVIGLISILNPNKVSADTIVSNGSSSLFAATEVGTETKESVTNSSNTGGSFTIKFSYFSGTGGTNSWWMMCNEEGAIFREVNTYFVSNGQTNATSEEAYILSTLDTDNYKGYYKNNSSQIAWWDRGSATLSNATDLMYLSSSSIAGSLTSEQQTAINDLFSSGIINSSDTDAVKRELQIILEFGSTDSSDFTSYANSIANQLESLYNYYVSYNVVTVEEDGTVVNSISDNWIYNRIYAMFSGMISNEGLNYLLTLFKSGYFSDSSSIDSLSSTVEDTVCNYITIYSDGTNLYNELIEIYTAYYSSGSSSSSSVSSEAKAFASYIAKYSTGSTKIYTIDGQDYTAPVLNMKVSLDDDDTSVEFKATTQQWEIGPFTVTYPYETYGDIMFSGLYGASLKVIKNGVETELTYGNDWTFEYYYDRSNAPYEYPESGQQFYILINYDPQITYVSEFKLDYKYLNAGGVWINYSGYCSQCPHCGAYNDYGATRCKNGCRYHSGCTTDSDGNTTHRYKYYVPNTVDAQNMAVVVKAAQWYTNAELTWGGIIPSDKYSKITVEKTVIDDSGKTVSVDDTFTFDIYIDYTGTGNNYEKYTTLTVKTTDGYGKASISKIKWANDDNGKAIQPMCKIVERAKSGYTIKEQDKTQESPLNNGTQTFYYKNIKESKVGYLEVDKTFIDASPALENEEFTVYVTVSGTFDYYIENTRESGSVNDGSKTFTIILNSRNGFTWNAEFKWWDDDAPKYSGVKEDIPDGAAYKLYSISSKSGTLKAGSTKKIEVQNTDTYSRLYLDKSILGDTKPELGEVFEVKVSLIGDFKYVDEYGNTIVNHTGSTPYTIDVTLDQYNSWSWTSGYIIWTSSKAPQYSVYEEDTGSYEFYSVSTTTGSTKNNSTDEYFTFVEKINTATITNEKDEYRSGYIAVYKILETAADDNTDYSNYVFGFTVEITSDSAFQYGGTSYSAGEILTLTETINPGSANKWTSSKIKWKKGDSVPTYVVTETNIPSDTTFVSISNDDKTESDKNYISGKLSSGETVLIRITNETNITDNRGSINIVKEVTGDTSYLDALYQVNSFEIPVKFTLSVTGTFKYVKDGESEDSVTTKTYTSDDPLVLGSEDSPITITLKYENGKFTTSGTWSSGTFIWADDVDAPQYTIKELTESNDYFTFVDWTRGDDTQPVETSTITGTINRGTNTFAAHNETRYELRHGYIEVTKVVDEALTTDMTFTISVSYWGNLFRIVEVDDSGNVTLVNWPDDDSDKGFRTYTEDDPYSENISLTIPAGYTTATANGIELQWVVDKTSDSEQGPQWKAVETNIPTGMEFVSMYTESGTNQSNSLEGRLIDNGDYSKSSIIKLVCKNTDSGSKQGKLQISKTYIDSNGNEITGVEFKFNITITFYDAAGNKDTTRTITYTDVSITSGSYWRSNYITWNATDAKAPTYVVEEENGSTYNVVMTNDTGSLEENEIVKVAAKNTKPKDEEVSGTLFITKHVTYDDKISVSDADLLDDTFTFEVTITGTFTYNGTRYEDTSYTISPIYLTSGETWKSGSITWDKSDGAPEYVVTETAMPTGWEFSSWGSSGNSGSLQAGGNVTVECTNKYGPIEKFELIMALGGKVWDDTDDSDGKLSDVGENGVIDDDEPGIEGVKVTIYRVIYSSSSDTTGTKSGTIYIDGVEYTNYSTYTDANGNWYVENISVPGILDGESGVYAAYEVKFEYDGYTYEPTTYLAITSGSTSNYEDHFTDGGAETVTASEVSNYVGSASSDDLWLLNSQAKDNDRAGFNSKFTTIYGGSTMDDDGNTTGYATSLDSVPSNNEGDTVTTLKYSSNDLISALDSDNVRKVSTLNTTDSNGDTYSQYLTTASTYTAGLTYPFDYSSGYHLESWDKTVDDYVNQTTYTYSAIYNYVLSINLGLVQRESPDIAVEKDLVEATVVINGKVLTYKFNSYIDFDDDNYTDLLYKQLAIADREIEYSLGVYSSDYYYRASVYGDTSDSSSTASTLAAFYVSKLGYTDLSSLELEIYLKYNITVTNESETYTVEVKGLNDYYDNTLELVTNTTDSRTYVETYNGESVNEIMYLADSPSVTYYNSNGETVSSSEFAWTKKASNLNGGNITFEEVSTSLNKLAAGEKAVIETTFKISKSGTEAVNGVKNALELGEKHNMVEIASYSSYYSSKSKLRWSNEGDVTGRVDEDSAPDNIDLENYNDKTQFEDDTDAAPILTVGLVSEDREISGLVWEDAETETIEYNQTVGNGKYATADGDTVIAGLTTELVQAISIPEVDHVEEDTIYYKTASGGTTTDSTSSDIVYTEYDFIWPTNTNLNGALDEGYTLESITGFDSTTTTDSQGVYTFTSVPAGNYKVRFVYGDTKITTGNTDDEVVYNGQDYKSTSYQTGYESITDTYNSTNGTNTSDGYSDNAWHDLTNTELNNEQVSDARDNEARRLYITSKSEILTYENSLILSTADENVDNSEGSGNENYYEELFGNYEASKSSDNGPVYGSGYYMYAETAKIALDVENLNTTFSYDPIYDEEGKTTSVTGIEGTQRDGILTVTGTISKNGLSTGNDFTYEVNNIDFGIEERSQTKITLDKQIKEITLTNDGNVILDAVFDITYELGDDDTIKSSVVLNKELSTGYDTLQSLNRTSTTQGSRYIAVDTTILQGTTITVQYQLTAFNVSEADTCNVVMSELWNTINTAGYSGTALEDALTELTSPYYTSTTRLNRDEAGNVLNSTYQYGTYVGSKYYLGINGNVSTDETEQMLVETTVRQIIDYVDPDVEFVATDNLSDNQAWSTTTVDYLVDNKLIDTSSIKVVDKDGTIITATDDDGTVRVYTYDDAKNSVRDSSGNTIIVDDENYYYTFLSDDLKQLITTSQNNVILSMDKTIYENEDDSINKNSSLVKETIPYTAAEYIRENVDEDEDSYKSATASINLQVSKYYSSEDESSDIDNIAEIIKVENTVGRRDIRNIAGNTSTYEIDYDTVEKKGYTNVDDIISTTVSVFDISLREPDTSATEVITLTPPTGLDSTVQLVLQIVGIALVACVILAIGIIIIKKKVLTKK